MHLPYKAKRLAVDFDAGRLARETAAIPEAAWIFHGFHDTGHRVLPLVSAGGTVLNDDGSPNHSLIPPFLPTAHLARLPYIDSVIHSFGTRPFRARLAELRPGDVITPHRDLHPNWYNKVRLHVPIATTAGAVCHVWDESPVLRWEDHDAWHMAAGEAWVFDIWRVHAVTNFSAAPRIHLIIDFQPEGRLFELMFADRSREDILACMGYSYPGTYRTDWKTLTWLSGGRPELGRRLWNVDVQERNPQLSSYTYPQAFWDPAAYTAPAAE